MKRDELPPETQWKCAGTNTPPISQPATCSGPPETIHIHHRRPDKPGNLSSLGPGTSCIVEMAAERGIPAIRLNQGNLMQLGYGARQRHIWATETVQTTAIAENIAGDKALSKRLLQSCGVPVAQGRLVDSSEDAWEAAQEIGLPVAVKPCDSNDGLGISLDVSTRAQVEAAYRRAREKDCDVMVERFVAGHSHRLLIVGSRLVAAARQPAATEGEHAAAIDVSASVHPETAAAAALTARIIGLDIAGVDVIADDISQPLAAQRGAIVGVNARPDLVAHFQGDEARRRVGRSIVDHLFAGEENGRIPIVGIAGSRGGTQAAHMVTELLRMRGDSVGLACADGLYLNQRQIARGDCTGWESAQRILMNRAVNAAVFESGSHAILPEGLGYDGCKVGIVTGIESEGPSGMIRTQVGAVRPDGFAVLNADNARVAMLAPLCEGQVIFFASTPDAPLLAEHRSRQGRVAFIRDCHLVLAAGADEIPITALQPASDAEAMLAAAAAAWALEVPVELIRTGLEAFADAGCNTPTHFNLTTSIEAITQSRKPAHGNHADTGIARPQSLEPENGHRSSRSLLPC